MRLTRPIGGSALGCALAHSIGFTLSKLLRHLAGGCCSAIAGKHHKLDPVSHATSIRASNAMVPRGECAGRGIDPRPTLTCSDVDYSSGSQFSHSAEDLDPACAQMERRSEISSMFGDAASTTSVVNLGNGRAQRRADSSAAHRNARYPWACRRARHGRDATELRPRRNGHHRSLQNSGVHQLPRRPPMP